MRSLPIDPRIPDIQAALRGKDVVILTATPGSGKTTRVPPALLDVVPGKILVLEPRRVAAMMAAHRVAEERKWALGREVGYRVRFESRAEEGTRLQFLTEALLAKELLKNPDLEGVSLVILDEFHERSIHVDTALALMKELRLLSRPDLKILIMSATLDTQKLQTYCPEASVVSVAGETHPLEIRYDQKAQILRPTPDWYDRMAELARKAFRESPGKKSVLVFLPGTREIERLAERLRGDVPIERLHGQLPLEEQQRILRDSAQRRIILTTNVAESSVTVDGVDTVVDSGLEKISQIHPRTNFASLDLVRVSKASAAQRAGRAARQGPGLALRAWSALDERSMAAERPAEIFRSDLSELVLTLAGLGIRRPETLPWYEIPPETELQKARDLLIDLGAIGEDGGVTGKGKAMAALPLAPRWAAMIVEAEPKGEKDLALNLAALVQGLAGRESSASFLEAFERWRERPEAFPLATRIRRQLQSLAGNSRAGGIRSAQLENRIAELLCLTFPDRLCRRRKDREPSARMVGGRGVRLPDEENKKSFLFFFALDLMEGTGSASETRCNLYLPLTDIFVQKVIRPRGKEDRQVIFDPEREKFWTEQTLRYRDLPLEEPRRSPADPSEIGDALARYVFENWDHLRPRFPELQEWLIRYQYWRARKNEDPDYSRQLPEILAWAGEGETSLKALEKKDLIPYFSQILLEGRESEFQRDCPVTLISPKGRRVKVEYSPDQPPRIEIKIQDAFGWKETPRILGEPVVTDLLAPNGRPAQRTRDLQSFWRHSYKEIRKELRARYPKHAWPEEP